MYLLTALVSMVRPKPLSYQQARVAQAYCLSMRSNSAPQLAF